MAPNPSDLAPSAVRIPDPELREAIVLDDAAEPGRVIRCVVPGLDPLLATDPMPWFPYVTAAGLFYPKRDDRAVIGKAPDGAPVILFWWPSATEPDSVLP